MNDWFEKLVGFSERTPAQVHETLLLHGTRVSSRVNGESFECGRLEIVSLQKLRDRVAGIV